MVSRFINYLDFDIIPDMVSRFITSDVNEIAFNDAIQKQNMTLDGFSTTKDLDRQLETILKSIEPEVMKSLTKSNYFNKQYQE